MDFLSFFLGPILRGHAFRPAHNEGNPQQVAPSLLESEVQARCPGASLLLDASLRACASEDERGPLRCPDKRRSTASASRPAASADPRSSPTSPHPAIANRRGTAREDVPAAQIH